MPTVSVIIPCYNQGRYLAQAVESVIAQTMPDWECIIVNDGSTDNTGEVALSLAERDSRIRYIEQENGGTSAAKNAGLNAVRGRYVQFLDADDWIMPTKFELQVKAVEGTEELAVSYCDYEFAVEDSATEPPLHLLNPMIDARDPLVDIATRWGRDLGFAPNCLLLDARFFTEQGICFEPSICFHEDYDCWLSVFALRPRLAKVPEKLAVYRLHGGTATEKREQMLHGKVRVLLKQRRLLHRNKPVRRALDRRYHEVWEYAYSVLPPIERLKLRALRASRRLNKPMDGSDCRR